MRCGGRFMKRALFVVSLLAAASFLSERSPGQALPPQEALKRFQVADGFQVKLVASEPQVRQPVTMTFDDRGRIWVIQYLQYPNPAGLKPVKVDQFLRTVYDRVPEPPPKGPKGADKITILEDADGDGFYEKAKDFVTGLNLASGMALGHGGVFVAQPPYLLFYADQNGDDVPDGDPEVLLTGFGMEDSHAFANSLQWGPDGWLYGAHGSTVTANIRGIEFQQGIWRYHPHTKEFELFAEGGGNTWGLDFDARGQVIAGTNFGGVAMLHQVQGAYYVKGFAKHGPLHNPHSYGYFEHVPYQHFKGGHVTCGGIVYHGGAFPDKFTGQYIAANLLSNAVYWHVLERKGSSFTSRFGGELLVSSDPWFRPIDCLVGPDGAVYIVDWYDQRANHVDPVDNWDRTNGRIYKLEPAPASGGRKPPVATKESAASKETGGLRPPLAKRSSEELLALLAHPNDWYRREARRILAERRDPGVLPALRAALDGKGGATPPLQALWALYVSGGFDAMLAEKLLNHADQDVRAWTVRLIGESRKVPPALKEAFIRLARTDPSPTVRSQLACTAERLPSKEALPIVHELLRRAEDASDPHIPLLLWWAIEDKAISDREQVLGLLDSAQTWRTPLIAQFVIERLARRYMAEGTDAGYSACARLLAEAPDQAATRTLIRGMEKALEGRRLASVPAALEKPLAKLWQSGASDLQVIRFALRLGSEPAYRQALDRSADPKMPQADRLALIEVVGQAGSPVCVPVFLGLLAESHPESIRLAALAAVQTYPDEEITKTVLALYPKMSAALRGRAETLLASRPASALAFLKAVDAGTIPAKDVPLDQLRRLVVHEQPAIQQLIEKHWGKVGAATAGEKQSRIRSVAGIVRSGKGDFANGRLLFQKHCANCHVLFGEGTKLGPDLTAADRKNLDLLLTHVIDPSAMIRPEYVSHLVQTNDGQVLTGLVVEATPAAITLVNEKNEKTVLARASIDVLKPIATSLMPEKLLDPLENQELRDLLHYVQSEGRPSGK